MFKKFKTADAIHIQRLIELAKQTKCIRLVLRENNANEYVSLHSDGLLVDVLHAKLSDVDIARTLSYFLGYIDASTVC